MNRPQNSKVLTWISVDTTLGGVGLVGVAFTGSAAVSTLTFLDGTDIKFAIPVASTQAMTYLPFYPAVAFKNLVVDETGTSGYSVVFVPRP